ncbi:MAG: hypothetical protein KA715_12160 [Xanthomonadaceae bacterium]|nr:hypothetical protein [Xanthomonadaceae bacterium]
MNLVLVNALVFSGIVQFSLPTAQAQPTPKELYRDPKSSLVVYADSRDKNLFWYVPKMVLAAVDGKSNVRKRVKSDKSVQFSFMIKPEFTDADAKSLSARIPALRSMQQLKPVKAKKFGLQVPAYNYALVGDDVTNYEYVNQEQLLRFTVPAEDAFDLEDDLEYLKPGLPAKVFLSYEAEKTSAYATVKLTIDDVKKSLGIRAGAEYKFLEPEIKARVSEFISNRNLDIKVKGDVPHIAEIVTAITNACFAKTSESYLDEDLDGKPRRRRAERQDTEDDDGDFPDRSRRRRAPEDTDIEPVDGTSGTTTDGPTTEQPGSSTSPEHQAMDALEESMKYYRSKRSGKSSFVPGSSQFHAMGGDLLVWLRFAPEKETCKGTIYYNHEAVVDSQEIAVYTTYLTTQMPNKGDKPTVVTPLGSKRYRVDSVTSPTNPYKTGIIVKNDDHWSINTEFEFYAISAYDMSSKKTRYRWNAEWPSPDSELYYRIGEGPWAPVNGRTIADSIEEGELQFYVDRAKLWSKIPEEGFRKGKMGGIVPPIYIYKNFYPEFIVTATGRAIR